MLVVGLTGGIAMGKTTLSRMLSKRGIPVVDADAIVHQLYSEGGRAVPAVRAAFPSAVIADRVDRTRLASLVVGRKDEFKRLESIVHPLVAEERASRVREFEQKGKPLVFLDIPLLFETGGEADVDVTVVVRCSQAKQRDRALGRANMTEEKFNGILTKQMPIEDKVARADYTIDTDTTLEETDAQVQALLNRLLPDGYEGHPKTADA